MESGLNQATDTQNAEFSVLHRRARDLLSRWESDSAAHGLDVEIHELRTRIGQIYPADTVCTCQQYGSSDAALLGRVKALLAEEGTAQASSGAQDALKAACERVEFLSQTEVNISNVFDVRLTAVDQLRAFTNVPYQPEDPIVQIFEDIRFILQPVQKINEDELPAFFARNASSLRAVMADLLVLAKSDPRLATEALESRQQELESAKAEIKKRGTSNNPAAIGLGMRKLRSLDLVIGSFGMLRAFLEGGNPDDFETVVKGGLLALRDVVNPEPCSAAGSENEPCVVC